jgi:hypothetical protein
MYSELCKSRASLAQKDLEIKNKDDLLKLKDDSIK